MAIPAILGAIAGPVIGAISSAFGQAAANQESERSTQKQMDFQERMSNTQYQRGMADMKLAGLNPILAYKQGGASAPVGSSYTAGNVGGGAVAAGSAASSSGLQAARQKAELDQIMMDTNLKHEMLSTQRATQTRELAQASLAGTQAVNTQAHTAILGETLSSARAAATQAKTDEEFYGTEEGQAVRKLNRWMEALSPFISSGAEATHAYKRKGH